MKKNYNKYFDETYYTETLTNGLTVIIFYKKDFKTSICSFGTPYGALNINQKLNGKEYHFNPGVAHFLEHKLFESKSEDMMAAFSSMGANVNAFTSYNETVFYFTKTGKDIIEPLNLLLDFVQDLNISEESVEKEKGIIAQEVAYYEQIPEQALLHQTYKCLYKNYPLIYDIGGDKKAVYKVSKKELDTCYAINYHPSNMVLCITTCVDPKVLIKSIKNNQNKKKFKKLNKPICNDKKEPYKVNKKTYEFKMPISTDKHIYALKLKPDFKDNNEAFKYEWSLRILLEANLSSLNPNYQNWLDNKLINDYFGYEIDVCTKHAYVLFYDENDDASILKKHINSVLSNYTMNQEILDQLKHRFIGSMFDTFDDVESFNNGYIRDYLNGLDFFDAFKILNSITLKDVNDSILKLDFDNSCFITMKK